MRIIIAILIILTGTAVLKAQEPRQFEIARGNSINLNEHASWVNSYIRACVVGKGGVAYTQPFGVVAAGAATESSWQTTDWEPMFQGIDTATGEADSPRLMRVYALRIDTQAEGVEFHSTPRAEEDFADNVKETVRQTVPEFLETNNLQVAVNANFYSPFNAETVRTPGPSVLRGLAVSQGIVVSKNERNFPAFLVFKDNRVDIVEVQDDSSPPAEVETAVAGNRMLVKDGTVLPQSDEAVHPRTTVGISKDGRYVYFVVIDGRQPEYSIGTSYTETGQWLVKFGAWSGLNLDGGGSTTMVVRSQEEKAKALNVPVGRGMPNTFRYNGNNLGVRAMSLAL